MRRVLPILFNTDMTEAVLEGRKGVTRRAVKYKYDNTTMQIRRDKYGSSLIEIHEDRENVTYGKIRMEAPGASYVPTLKKKCHAIREIFCMSGRLGLFCPVLTA